MAGLVGGEHDRLTIRQPGAGVMFGLIIGKLPRFSDAGRKEHEIARRSDIDERPFTVRRKTAKVTFSEPDGRRTIRWAQKNTGVGAGCFSALGEQDGLAVGRHVAKQRPVKPRKAAFACLARCKRKDTETRFICG